MNAAAFYYLWQVSYNYIILIRYREYCYIYSYNTFMSMRFASDTAEGVFTNQIQNKWVCYNWFVASECAPRLVFIVQSVLMLVL